jgi:YfiH family protein
VLRHSFLDGIAGLVHGVLLPNEADRDRGLAVLGIEPSRLCRLRQVHGTEVVEWYPATAAERAADGVVLRSRGRWAEIRTADCVPLILIGDGELAVVHAGWRGVFDGMAGAAVGALRTPPTELAAVLGPHIGPCCYEVSAELGARFSQRFEAAVCVVRGETASAPGASAAPEAQPRIDLAAALRFDLISAGVAPERIHADAPCTYCSPGRLPSWRRQGKAAGRLRTVLGFAPEA